MKFVNNLAAMAVACLSVSCDNGASDAAWWQGEQERIDLSQQLKLKEFRYETARCGDFQELQEIRKQSAGFAESQRTLSQSRESLFAEIGELENQWDEFRRSTIQAQRRKLIGRTFEEFATSSGKLYHGMSIVSIDDGGVTIRHRDGSARLGSADFDMKQRAMFGIESDLEVVAKSDESKDAAAYDRWVEIQVASTRAAGNVQAEITRREDDRALRAWSSRVASQASAARSRPLAQPATSVGYGSSYYPRYRSYYRPTYYYNYTPHHHTVYPTAVSIRTGQTVGPCYTPRAVAPRGTSFANTLFKSTP